MLDLLDMAQRLLAGEPHRFFAARRRELSPLLANFIDLDGPTFSDETFRAAPPISRLLGAERPAILERAELLFRSLLSGQTEHLSPLFADFVWVLDRSGPARYTSRQELLTRLETTRSEPRQPPRRLRSYTTAELKSRWPAPIGLALESLLGGQSGLYVAGKFEASQAAILFGPGPSTPWVAHSFLLPAWDGPVLASGAISSDEHDGVRAADRLARALLLGLPATVQSLNNLVMPRLLWNDRITTIHGLIQAAHAIGVTEGLAGIELGFKSTRRLSEEEAEIRVPRKHLRFVFEQAEGIWYDRPAHLGLTWCETEPFRWLDGETTPLDPVHIVTLRRMETDVSGEPVVRTRIGGIFPSPGPTLP